MKRIRVSISMWVGDWCGKYEGFHRSGDGSYLALALGHELGALNNADYYQMIEELSEIPQKMEKVLEQTQIIKDISECLLMRAQLPVSGSWCELSCGDGGS